MVITPIQKTTCPNSRAGLYRIWAVDCADVVDVLIEDGSVHNVTLVDGVGWKQIQFDKGTAYLQQEKLIANGYETYVKQSLYFELAGLSNEKRNALEDLNGVCCGHFIVKDNSGNYHYAGITYNHITEEWQSEDMRTGEGSANTNTDPTADQAEYIETLVCNAGFYAPFWSLGEGGIAV